MILACSCKTGPAASYQDEKYGVGKRVHTPTAKDKTYRCTLCGHEQRNLSRKEAEEERRKAEAEKEAKSAPAGRKGR